MVERPVITETWDRRVFVLCAMALFVWYSVQVIRLFAPVAGGADSSGYANAAKQIAHGQFTTRIRELDELNLPDDYQVNFIPLGLVTAQHAGTTTYSYPVGLPLLMAIFGALGGWEETVFWIVPITSVLGLLAMYALARQFGLSVWSALAACAILGYCPTYYLFTIVTMSDSVSTAVFMGSLLFAIKSSPRKSFACCSGLLFGLGVLIRPTNVLLFPAMIFALPTTKKHWFWFVLGGIPMALILATNNFLCFGDIARSGYGNVSALLKLSYFPERSEYYALQLYQQLTPVVLLGWLALPFVKSVPIRLRMLLLSWPIPCFLFYFCYYFADAWTYTRFLLPGIPALILGSLLTYTLLLNRIFKSLTLLKRTVLIVGTCLIVIHQNKFIHKQSVRLYGQIEIDEYVESVRLAQKHFSDDAFMLCMQHSGAIRYYSDLRIVRYDRNFSNQQVKVIEQLRSTQVPLGAILHEYEVADAQKRIGGKWTKLEKIRDVSIWKVDLTLQ